MPKCDGLTIRQRLTARYKVDPLTGCWNWTAGLNGKGYAYIWTGPRRKGDTRQAYKVSWELKYGPVPPRMELHHVCDNPRCVNPDHLIPLTHQEHQRISPNTIAGINRRKLTCPKGHPYSHRNANGARCCRICARDWMRRKRREG